MVENDLAPCKALSTVDEEVWALLQSTGENDPIAGSTVSEADLIAVSFVSPRLEVDCDLEKVEFAKSDCGPISTTVEDSTNG